MTTRRLVLLVVLLIAMLGAVYVLPAASKGERVGIVLSLPQYVGKWYGVDQAITDRERQILAADTEFARKLYTDGLGNAIFASIVLSGHDLDNSIHRPERCLPAQGWTVVDSRMLQLPLADGRRLPVTRLHNVRQAETRDHKQVPVYNLNYYWFVGYNHVTASHLERTIFDIQDRVLKGYNQRWAYITISSEITQNLQRFGRSESQTDTVIQDFIRQLVPEISQPNEPAAEVAQRSQTPIAGGSL